MLTAIKDAWNLIITLDPQLLNILSTTARMSLASSLISLIIGTPIGILYGYCRFPGRRALIVLNRTLVGMPPVVCGLIFYILFSGVGPFRHLHLMFTVTLMVLAQVVLIIPVVVTLMETATEQIALPFKETARGLKLRRGRAFALLLREGTYPIISTYLLAFARAIAEVGAISMVGGAIAWKTNVMTTAIMQYTNMGDFSLGIALGLILMVLSLVLNIVVSMLQRRLSR